MEERGNNSGDGGGDGGSGSAFWTALRWAGVLVLSAAAAGLAYGLLARKIQVDRTGVRVVQAQRESTEVRWTNPVSLELSTDRDEYEPAVSPDGTEMYFVRQTRQGFADVFVSLRRNNRWTRPMPVTAINTSHDETSPRLTADGEYLLFSSERPGGQGRYDIWASKRTEDGWGEPFNLGPQVNSPLDEHSPSMTPDNRRLFFASNRSAPGDAWGGKIRQHSTVNFDIYAADSAIPAGEDLPVMGARAAVFEFKPAEPVAALNSPEYDGSSAVSPRGDFIYFTSNRAGGFGGFDLYRAPLAGNQPGAVENLGASLNTLDNEADPSFGNAGFQLYFSSNRVGSQGADDLYASESREVVVRTDGRADAPKLGLNSWLLIACAGLFFPMLMLARTPGASALQRCIVMSLVAHLLLVVLFNGVRVSGAIVQYVKKEMGMEIPINLEAARVAEVQLQVRNQLTQIATPSAEMEISRMETNREVVQQPLEVAVNVPNAAVRPGEMAIELPRATERPSIEVPVERVAVADDALLEPVAPRVELPTPEQVRVEESVARANAPKPDLDRVEPKLTADAETIALGMVPLNPDTSVPGPVVAATNSVPPLPDAVEMGTQVNVEMVPEIILPRAEPQVAQQTPQAPPPVEAPVAQLHQESRPDTTATTAELSVPKLSQAPQSSTMPNPLAAGSLAPDVSAAIPAELELSPPIAAMDITLPTPDDIAPPIEQQPLVSLADVIPVPRPDDARPPSDPRHSDLLRPGEAVLGVARHGSAMDLLPDAAGLRDAAETGVDAVQAHAQVASLTGPMGPKELFTVETLAQRAEQQRQQMIEELGGNAATEDAVDRALAWLARNQMADGRWTKFHGPRSPLRDRDNHDIALTALASLCFLGADHTPAKDGPYRETVRRGIEFITSQQSRSGDLRGRGNMYDHSMATIAVSEAAYMTGDERYRAVARKAADFIVAAQRAETGGWQYAPGEFGDTSVTGWCLMALHSAERVGYTIPPRTKQAAMKWLERVTAPGDSLLAGYQNRTPATPSMTAKNVFCRILLGQSLSPKAVKEASDFIASVPPDSAEADYYYWYYASISLMQLQNDGWTRWNLRLRDYLLRHQRGDGEAAGSWDADAKWADRGGRVYCTAMATLTLEVYYRYLPMYAVRATPPPQP